VVFSYRTAPLELMMAMESMYLVTEAPLYVTVTLRATSPSPAHAITGEVHAPRARHPFRMFPLAMFQSSMLIVQSPDVHALHDAESAA